MLGKLSHLDRTGGGLNVATAVLTEGLGSLDLLDKGIRVLEVREAFPTSAAERTATAIDDDSLTAGIAVSRAAAHFDDGGAGPSTADIPDKVLIVEDAINRVGDDGVAAI